MKEIAKSFLIMALFLSTVTSALADRGISKKNNNKVNLNISTTSNLKTSVFSNLNSGLKYTGSLLSKQVANFNFNSTLITYQKGNTVYILPYKQIVAVPEMRSGYTGVKLIIKPH